MSTRNIHPALGPEKGIPAGSLVWKVNPTEFALKAANAHRMGSDVEDEICLEVGRRLLLAQYTFSSWVLRRVEKVAFSSDRRLKRSSTIELRVPEDAPVIVDGDGEPHWLIPLSVMRRRTLVSLDISDKDGDPITLMGLRFAQSLDETMLRAVARMIQPQPSAKTLDAVDAFITKAISGKWQEIREAHRDSVEARASLKNDPPERQHPLAPIFEEPTFVAALERLWHNFTLYAALPVSAGRHRLLKLAFEEQLTWRFQTPVLKEVKQPDGTAKSKHSTFVYEPMTEPDPRRRTLREVFALKPTRVRFLTPSAENCASYHFEFTAPTGLSIAHASLVAGRPNEDGSLDSHAKVSWDAVDNPGHSAGLHAVEIPNGSLCRAQVDLRIPSRGWLGTVTASCVAIALVMITLLIHARLVGDVGGRGFWSVAEVTNIVVLLVSVCAGAVTYVAHHHATDVVARMASGLRAISLLALCIPAATAIGIVYLKAPLDGWRAGTFWILMSLATLVSLLIAGLIFRAWYVIMLAERKRGRPSPWDMTRVIDIRATVESVREERRLEQEQEVPADDQPLNLEGKSFIECVQELGFDTPAIGVYSAEGWHERYRWTNSRQTDALKFLGQPEQDMKREPGRDESDAHRWNPAGCPCKRATVHVPEDADALVVPSSRRPSVSS
jgi:hypothetical protein